VKHYAKLDLDVSEFVAALMRVPGYSAAAVAAGGLAGVYGLRPGEPILRPQFAYWFSKPEGATYRDLDASLATVLEQSRGALWIRQMALGPAPELCLQVASTASLPDGLQSQVIQLRPIWPE
jgi:hypothetical protein